MDIRFLQTIYQQWSDGQSDVAARWVEFIEFASKQLHQDQETLRRELQKTHWFQWRREE
jgi:hypothetical protein